MTMTYERSTDEWWSGLLQAGEDVRTLSPEWLWELADKYGFEPNSSGPIDRSLYPDLFQELSSAKSPSRIAAQALIQQQLAYGNADLTAEEIDALVDDYLQGYRFRLWSFLCFACHVRPKSYHAYH